MNDEKKSPWLYFTQISSHNGSHAKKFGKVRTFVFTAAIGLCIIAGVIFSSMAFGLGVSEMSESIAIGFLAGILYLMILFAIEMLTMLGKSKMSVMSRLVILMIMLLTIHEPLEVFMAEKDIQHFLAEQTKIENVNLFNERDELRRKHEEKINGLRYELNHLNANKKNMEKFLEAEENGIKGVRTNDPEFDRTSTGDPSRGKEYHEAQAHFEDLGARLTAKSKELAEAEAAAKAELDAAENRANKLQKATPYSYSAKCMALEKMKNGENRELAAVLRRRALIVLLLLICIDMSSVILKVFGGLIEPYFTEVANFESAASTLSDSKKALLSRHIEEVVKGSYNSNETYTFNQKMLELNRNSTELHNHFFNTTPEV